MPLHVLSVASSCSTHVCPTHPPSLPPSHSLLYPFLLPPSSLHPLSLPQSYPSHPPYLLFFTQSSILHLPQTIIFFSIHLLPSVFLLLNPFLLPPPSPHPLLHPISLPHPPCFSLRYTLPSRPNLTCLTTLHFFTSVTLTVNHTLQTLFHSPPHSCCTMTLPPRYTLIDFPLFLQLSSVLVMMPRPSLSRRLFALFS